MSLMELVNNSDTDKNTIHSYIETYESIFSQRKESAKNILEIGIGDFKELNGGSIELWYKYFTNARIYAVDKLDITRVLPHIQNNPRIQINLNFDSYTTINRGIVLFFPSFFTIFFTMLFIFLIEQ